MKRILIIDDDEDLVVMVKRILQSNGFNVLSHHTGSNAADVVKHFNPHLILIDICVYGESGTDICKQLKRRYDIPIILFSGDTKKGEAFAQCDADGFLQKPFDIDTLLSIINLHLKHDKAEV